MIVLIHKMGNLCSFDNWCGITLMEVVGKVVARVVQGRLQSLADRLLPESQCGFHGGRGCTDMTFVVRKLVEKALEHRTRHFLFSLISRCMICTKGCFVVGDKKVRLLIDIVKSFHETIDGTRN